MKIEEAKGIATMSYKKLFKFLEGMNHEDLNNLECKIMMPGWIFKDFICKYGGIDTDEGDLFGIACISKEGKEEGLLGVHNFKNIKEEK